jgi:histidine triad (HIT) family protein
MASVFTLIIEGEIPARFVWKDDVCVAFLSINPLRPGHTLVVPRAEVSHWIDLDPATMRHLTDVAGEIGRAIDVVYTPEKVGMMIAGLEVPHVHLHVTPIYSVNDLDFANADPDPDPAALESAAAGIREQLTAMGRSEIAT